MASILKPYRGNPIATNESDNISLYAADFNNYNYQYYFWLGVRTLDGNDFIKIYDPGSVSLGAGNDRLDSFISGTNDSYFSFSGGSGSDSIFGSSARDWISGDEGRDLLDGKDGDDVISGDGDEIYGLYRTWFDDTNPTWTGDVDTIFGGNGNDTIIGGAAADIINAGAGKDVFVYENRKDFGDIINDFNPGEDKFLFLNLFNLNSGALSSPSALVRFVKSNKDTLVQTDLDGPGLKFSMQTVVTLKNINPNTLSLDNVIGAKKNTTTQIDPFQVVSSFHADLISDPKGGFFFTLDGDDIVSSSSGNSYLALGNGNDSFTANLGSYAYGGEGNDTLVGGTQSDHLEGNNGSDSIRGNAGNDLLVGDGIGEFLPSINYIEELYQSPPGDKDTVRGGDGADTIVGGTGADYLEGGKDKDLFIYTKTNDFGDVIADFSPTEDKLLFLNLLEIKNFRDSAFSSYFKFEQNKADTLVKLDLDGYGSQYTPILVATLKNINASSLSSKNIEGLTANNSVSFDNSKFFSLKSDTITIDASTQEWKVFTLDGDDIITASGSLNILAGKGNDKLTFSYTTSSYAFDRGGYGYGGDGNDTLIGGKAGDDLYGNAGADSITGMDGYDLLIGDGDDPWMADLFDKTVLISTPSGNDILNGGNGNDTLVGGPGSDRLTGGAGADYFTFELISESDNKTRDTITDFKSGEDKIDLLGIDVRSTQLGDQAFSFNASKPMTAAAYSVWYIKDDVDNDKVKDDLILYGDVNGNTTADFEVALLNVSSLKATDFFL